MVVFPLEAHRKGNCVAVGILIFWGKDCQCKYSQTVEFTLCFDLMTLTRITRVSNEISFVIDTLL